MAFQQHFISKEKFTFNPSKNEGDSERESYTNKFMPPDSN